MSVKTLLKGGVILVALAASIFVSTGKVSAHHGNAFGSCADGVGVITAKFEAWGDRSNLLGNITVKVDGQVVEEFKATADNFTRTYKPYVNGEYTVRADWVMDYNRNQKADSNEKFSFENKVKISGCTPKEEKCTVPGKTHLPKNDPNCKVDEKCVVPGKENLPKNDPACKKDEEKCTIAGKTHLPKNDPNCKEVLGTTTELPKTGAGTSILALPVLTTIAGAVFHNRRLARK